METILRYRILGPRGDIWGDDSALQDFGAREDNLGDKLADKLGDNFGPEARSGNDSALQDFGAPRDDNLGDKLADKLGDNLVFQDWRRSGVTAPPAIPCCFSGFE